MSSWFDKLLEEMQRRQMEQDYAREGRPLPPRPPVGPPEEQIPDDDDRGDGPPPPRRLRPRRGRPERSPGNWVRPILFLAGIFILIQVLGGLVQLFTDLAWYSSLGRRDVLLTRFVANLGWFVVGFLLFTVPALLSLWVARRLGPQVPIRRVGPVEVPDLSGPVGVILIGVTLVGGLISAFAWGGNWPTLLLFFNGGDFGTADAAFGRDIGFYVFDLPFWRFVQGWVVLALAVIIGLTVAAYAIAATRWSFHLTAPVRAHVSLLGAGLLLAIAAGYQLDAAELVYSTRGIGGTVQAAMYTDMSAQVPAYTILTIVAVVSAGLLLANIFFRTLWLIGLAAGAWFVLSIVVGGFYPGAVQRFGVEPNELERERPYLERHLAATRAAFDLDAIEERDFTGEQRITRALFDDNEETLDNLRLWDYRPLLVTFGQQQILRQYYNFLDVDIDRYQIDDAERQIMLSAREIEIERLADAARTWTNERLVFTHGYGLTAVRSNAITPEGQPDYLVSGINRNPDLPLGEPRIYFGEAASDYVVVRTRTLEFDYPTGDEGGETTSWTGETGVPVDNVLSRLMFAIRFGDLNLLISDQLTSESAILFHRDIRERVPELAPFLEYDRDPYLVNADDRLVWIWDAYTHTDRYPNAQPLTVETPFPGVNYIRNSVKVVVDAYTGDVRFYVTDPDEPIVAAWSAIFPGLFEPISEMPESLVAHLRYPEDLFTAQNTTYLLYHISPSESGAGTFYNQDDRWSIPTQVSDVTGEGGVVEPYYVIMKVPGEDTSEFVLIQPLVAANRPNMIAWVAARMDPGVYGERIEFRFPVDTTTLGPAQVQARINQDSRISEQFTLWSQAGSDVVRGDLLVLPMGDSILYVEPIYLRSTQSSFPEFKRVILADQTRIAFAETLDEALRQLLGEVAIPEPEPGEPTEPGGGGELPGDVAALIALAGELYDEAQQALEAGDLGAYQDAVDELGRVLDRIAELTGDARSEPGFLELGPMAGWLANAGQALRVAVERSDLWLGGAVVAFAGAGWIVLLGTVSPTPDAADMASLGLQLAASPWWPWNVVVLGVAVVSALASLLLVIAFGEAAIHMGLSGPESEPSVTVPRAFGILALAALPVGVLALVVGWLAAPGFVAAVTAPSGETPLLLRILREAWPLLVVIGLAVVMAQAFAASRLHRSSPSGGDGGAGRPGPSRPRLVVQAAVTLVAFLAFQLATAAILFVLWTPLQTRLDRAGLAEPTTIVLLLGFVWIWLVLLILAGMIQAWISAWWTVELGSEPGG